MISDIKHKISKNSGMVNLVINLSILALLIYLSVSVKQLQDKVFPNPNIMIPLMSYDNSKQELEYNIREFLNNVIEKAITEQETQK
jgi:hypothetical protein